MTNFRPGDKVTSEFDGVNGTVMAWIDGGHMRVVWDDGLHSTESMTSKDISLLPAPEDDWMELGDCRE